MRLSASEGAQARPSRRQLIQQRPARAGRTPQRQQQQAAAARGGCSARGRRASRSKYSRHCSCRTRSSGPPADPVAAALDPPPCPLRQSLAACLIRCSRSCSAQQRSGAGECGGLLHASHPAPGASRAEGSARRAAKRTRRRPTPRARPFGPAPCSPFDVRPKRTVCLDPSGELNTQALQRGAMPSYMTRPHLITFPGQQLVEKVN